MFSCLKALSNQLTRIRKDRSGNFALTTTIMLPVFLVAGGGVIDASSAYVHRNETQGKLDAAVLAAAGEPDVTKRFAAAASFMPPFQSSARQEVNPLVVVNNSDGSVTGTYTSNIPNHFLHLVGLNSFKLVTTATAMSTGKAASAAAPCIYVLGGSSQSVLINSGANVKSKECGVDVHSVASPAFIMNSGAKIETPRFCVKGTNYIKNGGTLTNLQTGCAASPDPYAGLLPEPQLSSKCDTNGVQSGTTFSLKPGIHCDVIFNGSPKITFKPGLHVIKGRMIINSGATVEAEGVTFFFPDVYSEIRANGGLTFSASAPSSGPYAGLLMFEATGSASNNSNKQQYIFNGSKGEALTGIIYLPNRDVTYNSTTNQASRISMVVNTVIMNSSNWNIEPFNGSSPFIPTGKHAVRLMN